MFRSKGAWALADQCVVSSGNFLTSVLLIRHWRGAPQTYGQYALVFSVVLFLNNVHAALVTYPLTVRGAACATDGLRRIARSSLALSISLAPLLALGLIAATMAAHRPSLLPFAAAALLLWQAQETLRRALLAKLRHRDALPGDAISYLGQAAVIWLIIRHAGGAAITPESAFAMVGLMFLTGAVVQACQLGVTPGGLASVRRSLADSWRVGRWVLFSTLLGAVATYASPWTLQGAAGPAEFARFVALATMLNLTNPIMITIAGLIVPAVAAARGEGAVAVRQVAWRYGLLGAVLLVPYFAFLMLMPRLALRAFYGPVSPYLGLALYLRVFVAGYILVYGITICTGVLNGLEQARGTFVAAVIAAAANAASTVPLAIRFGLIGATLGGIPPIILQLFVAGWMLRRATRGLKDLEPGSREAGVRKADEHVAGNREAASGDAHLLCRGMPRFVNEGRP